MKQETQKSWFARIGDRFVWLFIIAALILAGWGTFRLLFSAEEPEVVEVGVGAVEVLPDAPADAEPMLEENEEILLPNDPGDYE